MMITLTPAEMRMALTIGGERQLESLLSGRKDNHGRGDKSGWNDHIEGACGELAVAKMLSVHWGGEVKSFKNPDLEGNIQVRTRSQMNYDLIVRPDDSDDHLFILVLGKSPTFDVAGSIMGRDAKRPEYIQRYDARPEAYFVPRSKLEPFPP